MTAAPRDHGGGIDAAARRWGGQRGDWLDLSTGINPIPYPVPTLEDSVWTALPDSGATDALCRAARRQWRVPEGAAVLAAPGASALIARLPALAASGRVHIPGPTYNEHSAAFAAHGWDVIDTATVPEAAARVLVHPNNPDGRWWAAPDLDGPPMIVIDESFADTTPGRSLIGEAARPGVLILKSFGKFWGLAGLRLGFAIGDPALIHRLTELLGPWPVSGPALEIGALALSDEAWADTTRARLARGAARLDEAMTRAGARPIGGTTLFRLYKTDDAVLWQEALARRRIWTRVFPYDGRWLRLGLPGPERDWERLSHVLGTLP